MVVAGQGGRKNAGEKKLPEKKLPEIKLTEKKMPGKNDARLQSILEMARVMIADVGVEGLNMRDLAAATESSLRTLYTNFGSKDGLLAMVVADTFESLIDTAFKRHSRNRSAINQLLLLMQSLQRIALDKAMYARTFMGIYFKHGNDREIAGILYGMMYDRVGACVDQMMLPHGTPPAQLKLLKEEATDRVFSIVMKWTQGQIPDGLLAHRLIYATLTCLHPYASPTERQEIEQAMAAALKQLIKGSVYFSSTLSTAPG